MWSVILDNCGNTDPILTLRFCVCPAQKEQQQGHRWPGPPVCIELEFHSIRPLSPHQRRLAAVESLLFENCPPGGGIVGGLGEFHSVPSGVCLPIICFCFKGLGEGMLIGLEGCWT